MIHRARFVLGALLLLGVALTLGASSARSDVPGTYTVANLSSDGHTFHGLAKHLLRSHPYGASANFWSCPALPIVFAPDAPVPAG
jgi:hypothetical protein